MDARWSGIDPRLYFVTDTPLCRRAGRTVAQTAALAVAGGAGIVQVRDKTLGDADFLALTRQVLAAVASATRGTGRRVPVVVNDRVAVARALLDDGADVHVHVGQGDLPVAEVRRVLGPRPLIGLSAATAGECAAARAAYASVRFPVLALTFSDDELLRESGSRMMHDAYTGTPVDYRVITPQQFNLPRIGHFGFLGP